MLRLVHQEHNKRPNTRPVYLLCVFRDEDLLLEHFVEYYRSLGVTDFIMIDNLSQDEGPRYLKTLNNLNLLLYRADESYKDASFGTDWVNQLLQKHCTNQYCFAVDVDELFVLDTRKYQTLSDLMDDMDSTASNVVPVTLLDMYPERVNDDYQRGMDFLAHSPFFDDLNEAHYDVWHALYETFVFRVGGVRKRVLGITPCIQKFPFFKFDFSPLGLAPGYHVFQHNGNLLFESDRIRLHGRPSVLLHFKFLKPQFSEFVQLRISRNEDWNDSSEYRAYRDVLGKGGDALELFDPRFSRRFVDIESVTSFLRVPRAAFKKT